MDIIATQLALQSRFPTTVEFQPVLQMVDQFQEDERLSGQSHPHRLIGQEGVRSVINPPDVEGLATFMAKYGAVAYKVRDPHVNRWDPRWKSDILPLWAAGKYDFPQVRQFYTRVLGWLTSCAELKQTVEVVPIPVTDRSKMIKLSGPLLGDSGTLRAHAIYRAKRSPVTLGS